MLFANIYINETGKNKTKDSNAKNKKIKTSKQFNSKCNEIIPF